MRTKTATLEAGGPAQPARAAGANASPAAPQATSSEPPGGGDGFFPATLVALLLLPLLAVGAAVLAPTGVRERARGALARGRAGVTARPGLVRVRAFEPLPLAPGGKPERLYLYEQASVRPPDESEDEGAERPQPHGENNGRSVEAGASDAPTALLGAGPPDVTCVDCGIPLPTHARFCFVCGAAQAGNGREPPRERDAGLVEGFDPAPEAPEVPADATARPAAPGDELPEEPVVLGIAFWRGYVKGEFVATVSNGDESSVVVRSPAFRWRGRGEPDSDDPRAVRAHAALLETLAAAGWEPVSQGATWYASYFRRRPDDTVPVVSPGRGAS